jgi:integrase/recombinase XerD
MRADCVSRCGCCNSVVIHTPSEMISRLFSGVLPAFQRPLPYLYSSEEMKRASAQTVESYRDTFRLLLRFLQQTTGKAPSALHTLDLDAPVILRFLDHLECQRNNQPQSRNVRLAAVRSFFRMAAIRDPGSVGVATRVLAIPVKRTDKRLLGYLTRQEMEALLGTHELSHWAGRRDHALLLTLYNTGAVCRR